MGKDPDSLEKRLYNAWRAGKGLRLSHEDIEDLFYDDAIACRVSNTAAKEIGAPEPGSDALRIDETWRQLQQRLQEE